MRVVAGRIGGRMFESPSGNRTHPMSDKVRGAMFNTLGDIVGLTVLDAYAGSGALSIEAISRGAASSLAIDVDKTAFETIIKNIVQLRIDRQIRVIRANVTGWSGNNPDQQFDIVIADPPYDAVNHEALELLIDHVVSGGLFVCSLPPTITLNDLPDCELLTSKNYGDATITYFRKK